MSERKGGVEQPLGVDLLAKQLVDKRWFWDQGWIDLYGLVESCWIGLKLRRTKVWVA